MIHQRNSRAMKPTKKRSLCSWCMILLLVPLIAIAASYILCSDVDTPPSDFGSGQMFDMIASRYDMINRVLALRMDVGWRKRMVQIVSERVSANPRLLDVATGTADVALLLANAIPDSTIVGVDPSHNMLEVGRTKVRDVELEKRIKLIQGDARQLSSVLQQEDGGSFDGATMAFGIRNVPDRQTALCEIHRLLKPGAVFCILEFSEPPENSGFMSGLARIFIRKIVPVVGGILSGARREYLHLQNSIKDFPTPQEFGNILESLECGSEGRGSFRLDELIQMNFDSVQLYVATRIDKSESE